MPTRELAIQIATVTEKLTAAGGLRVQSLYGGRSIRPEHAALRRGAQVVVGTPGRTLDHLRQGNLDLGAVRFLVLDEADEMLDKGFAHDVEAILERTPRERQTALFSATMPKWVEHTAKKHLRAPDKVEVDADVQAPPAVEHSVYTIEKADKLQALQSLLDERDGAIIVFGRTKHGVKKLARQLDKLGYLVGALQGNLSQNAREACSCGLSFGGHADPSGYQRGGAGARCRGCGPSGQLRSAGFAGAVHASRGADRAHGA